MDCTVRTGCKPMIKAGVVKPYGQVCRKKQEKVVERNKTCWLQSQDGGQCRWAVGAGVPRKKGKKERSRAVDPLATKQERSPTARGSWGAGTTKQECRGQREPTDGLESQHETAHVESMREALNVKPVVDNVGP